MDSDSFHHQPLCSAPKCGRPAEFKIAAPWSSGSSHELKSYGLACSAHRDSQLALAQIRRDGLKLAAGETLGAVGLYKLEPGRRDTGLTRLPDHG
jgi:hypothetical protein